MYFNLEEDFLDEEAPVIAKSKDKSNSFYELINELHDIEELSHKLYDNLAIKQSWVEWNSVSELFKKDFRDMLSTLTTRIEGVLISSYYEKVEELENKQTIPTVKQSQLYSICYYCGNRKLKNNSFTCDNCKKT